MLLVVDVGNTNTVLGLYRSSHEQAGLAPRFDQMVANWRVGTIRTNTADEYGVLFRNLFAMQKINAADVKAVVVSSVVPPLDSTLREVSERYFQTKPLFIEPGVKTGMPVLVDNPAEVGADRIVNGVAAFERYGGPCIVVDFGTATTFDVISERGEYLGGAISPGVGISAEALFSRTARLPKVDIRKPSHVIGTNTVAHIQSGLFYGYIGLTDGLIERIIEEMGGAKPKIVSTGGLATLIASGSRYIGIVDEMLTLDGMRIIYERNTGARQTKKAQSAGEAKNRVVG